MQKDLGREPTEVELAEATNMNMVQVRKHMEVGRAARNKLIKASLFIYFQLILVMQNNTTKSFFELFLKKKKKKFL